MASPLILIYGMSAAGLPPGTLTSDDRVEIVRGAKSIDFRPRPDDPSRAGLIFFPGGLVDPEAYAPMARRLAEAGHHVVIVRLPFRLAPTHTYHEMVFETVRGTLQAPPRPWVIGGHSRGGKLASEFVAERRGRVAGLVLVATTHPREVDLSQIPPCVPVLRIAGSRDGVASVTGMAESRGKLPPHAGYLEIEGANHSQFGYYRFQLLDGRAGIDREAQQQRLVEALLGVLRPLPAAGCGQ
ncbi:MAG: alpha/beta hydrolase [Acidobacteriota bacterium]|nr:alpha/beta hydrolase [Acidobacteriota bacterium]MDQ3171543.1 alpha/beta hydrolase [Acidobacteriota bacterium]